MFWCCFVGLPGIVVLIAASTAHDGYGTDSRYKTRITIAQTEGTHSQANIFITVPDKFVPTMLL